MAAGGAKGWNGKGGAYVNGYALTFAKFDVIRHAIEAGYSPTFIDADVAVTGAADLRAAIAATNLYDLYIAKGHGPRCSTTIDGFIHCGKDCVVGGAAWRIMSRFADRKLSFDADPFAFWRNGRAGADGAAAQGQVLPRESALERRARVRVLRRADLRRRRAEHAGPDSGQEIGRRVPRAEHHIGGGGRPVPEGDRVRRALVRRGHALVVAGAARRRHVRLRARPLPPQFQGRVAVPAGVGGAQVFGRPARTRPLCRRGGRIDGRKHLQDRVPAGLRVLELLRRRARAYGLGGGGWAAEGRPSAATSTACGAARTCTSRSPSTGRARAATSSSSSRRGPPTSPASGAWVAADRLAQALGRELVPWNVPCALGWSDRQLVVAGQDDGRRHLGLRAALVESRCDVGFDAGGGRPRRGANATCCTAFFDLADNKCGGLAEQIVACADPMHRRRFEQEVSAADLAAAVTVGEVRGLGGGAGPRRRG